MKLKYLGTAAAEGWPAVFCNCEYCVRAKSLGGKNIRTRSQAMINDDFLIDFPTDTYHHMLMHRYDLSAVRYCFVTHSHLDHFQPLDLFCRATPYYAHDLVEPIISFYGNKAVCDRYKTFLGVDDDEPLSMSDMTEIKPFETVSAGKYKVTALPGNHAPREEALMYLIQSEGKTLLYLHDTGLLFDSVYEYLQTNGIRADLISYDCTYGAIPSGGGHMGLDSVPSVRKKLEDIGVADKNTVHVVNHFSHNGKYLHDEMAAAAAEIGFLCSYDGMEIEI